MQIDACFSLSSAPAADAGFVCTASDRRTIIAEARGRDDSSSSDRRESSAISEASSADRTKSHGCAVGRTTVDDRIRIDPSVVRGLEYYTGPVFEVELTFETEGRGRLAVRFGSVGGGGRYDGLVSRFRGEPVPATGFSIGVSRLLAALHHLGKVDDQARARPGRRHRVRPGPHRRLPAAWSRRCATPDIRAELYLGIRSKIGPQIKYADKRNAPCVVIQGGDEKAKGEVQIKDLILGAELAKLEQGPRRISEEAGRGAVRGAGRRAGRRGAQGARAARLRRPDSYSASRHRRARRSGEPGFAAPVSV